MPKKIVISLESDIIGLPKFHESREDASIMIHHHGLVPKREIALISLTGTSRYIWGVPKRMTLITFRNNF